MKTHALQHGKPWRAIGADEEGVALIELAVVLPVLAVLSLGIMEFSNFYYKYQLVQNGVRDAARYAASLPYAPTDATQNGRIKNVAVTGQPSGGSRRISWWTTTNVTVSWTTVSNPPLSGGLQTYRYSGDVPLVTVSASVPYSSLGFLGFLGLGSLTIKASHRERVIGVR